MSSTEQKASSVPALRTGARAMPVMPQSFEDVQRIATMAVRSELFKKAKQDEEPETTVARCSLAIMTGLDVGLSPAQSIQCIAVINGRCLIYGDAVPGVLWSHGFDIDQSIAGEGDARTATCTITRPGGKKVTRTFSVADAKKARLWDTREKVERYGKTIPNDSPWFRFSDRMLGWRALGFAKSDGASDVMRGLDIKENLDQVIDVSRGEYSEVRATPKKVLAELPDIPDEPVKQEQAPAAQPINKGDPRQDHKFLEDLDAAMAAVTDIDLLNEVHIHNDAEIEERGLQQEAGDLYKKHRERIYGGMDS